MGHAIDLDDAMRRELPSRAVDHRIAALANEQQGVVDRSQLIALGLHPRAIDRRIAVGRLHVLHRGVYAVGDRRLPPLGRIMAAVFAGGREAVASRRSAAQLHGIRTYDGMPEITVPPGAKARRGVRVTRARLAPDEITVVGGIPVTTVARTLVDLGAVLDARGVENAVREAEFVGVFNLAEVSRLLDRYPRRGGTAHLRRAVRVAVDSEGRTRSELEERFRALILDANLPTPELNGTVELGEITIEADAIWRDARLVVELDGRAAHLTMHGFESDRERDRLAALAGWTVIRLTWRQLSEQPQQLMRDLQLLIARRGS